MRVARAVALATAGALAITLLPAQPALAANYIGSGFFGVHDSAPVGTGVAGWPKASVGSIRIWDNGVSWRELEVAPGVWDEAKLAQLTAIVDTARSKGSHALLVLGQTPAFHSSSPTQTAFYGPGAAAMPSLSAWRAYIRKVATLLRGKGVSYQVWNEANVVGFWRGTPKQMAKLTQIADGVLRQVDPKATLVAPALGTRLGGNSGTGYLDKFYAQRVGGRPVAAYVDAVSLQLYPLASGSPESSMAQLRKAKGILAKRRVTKPIWNTEVNYGLVGGTGGSVPRLSNARQSAYVARTYVLNAANGVKRVYWYSWDLQGLANTRMTYADQHTVTPAGKAFGVVRSWLLNSRMVGCSRNRAGTYTCLISYASGKKRVYWNPSRNVYVRTAKSATWKQGVGGAKSRVRGGQRLRVGPSPVLVRSRR